MTAQSFAYEKKENSAVIWRCFSHDTKAEIPQRIEGLLVQEIAPYAFSAHMDQAALDRGIREGRIQIFVPEIMQFGQELAPALCGNRVESIKMPDTIRKVGRYCFYNCDNLQELEFDGRLSDWGSGSFTGCHKVKKLHLHVPADGVTWLKPVLEELREELRVRCSTEDGEDHANLLFPEFFEEGVENTPARILEERIHGMGMRYRNCFYNKRFDFRQYDSLFPLAVTQESEETMTELAMGRLRWPQELGAEAAKQYQDYVLRHGKTALKQLFAARDMEGLRWLCELEGADSDLCSDAMEQASALHFTEAVSYLMERTRSVSGNARRRRLL